MTSSATRRINRRYRRSERAQNRYARTLADIWSQRQDARGLALHLRDSLPRYGFHRDDLACRVYPGGIYFETPEQVAGYQLDDSPQRTLRFAAALAGAASFWVTDESADGKTFDVYVVERKQPW